MRIDASLKRRLQRLAANSVLADAGQALAELREFRFNGFPPTRLDLLSDWTANPHASRSWLWNTASFNFIPALIARHHASQDTRALDFAVAAAESWITSFPSLVKSGYEFAKHDHATALRVDNMLLLMATLILQRKHAKARPGIKKLILRDAALLEKEEFYSKYTNHGIEQARALALVAHCFPAAPHAERRMGIALLRLTSELEFAFTKEGVHVENSPAYHVMVCNQFVRAIDALPNEATSSLREKLGRIMAPAMTFLCHVIRPDGIMPIIGDTQALRPGLQPGPYAGSREHQWLEFSKSRGNAGKMPTRSAVIFPESGYLVVRDRWRDHRSFGDSFHLVMKCGWRSAYHRHDDDMNILLYYGEDWLIDGGAYSYDEQDPLRRYLRSKWAHNVPVAEAADDPLTFCALRRHEATLELLEPLGACVSVRARTAGQPGYIATRDIEVRRTKHMFVVRDEMVPTGARHQTRCFRSLWHIPSDKRLFVKDQNVLIASTLSNRALKVSNVGERFDQVGLIAPQVGKRDVLAISWKINQAEPCQALSFSRSGRSFTAELVFEFLDGPDFDEWEPIGRPEHLELEECGE